MCLLMGCSILANAELLHRPYGNNELYDSREVAHVLWERTPRDPIAGERVTLYAASNSLDRAQEVTLLWTLNGQSQAAIACTRYMEKDGQVIFRAKLPAFEQRDVVAYFFQSGKQQTAVFSFTVLGWEEGGCAISITENGSMHLTLDGAAQEMPDFIESIRYLTDGQGYLHACELTLRALPKDQYLGFGMRYNAQDQHGQIIHHYTVNWYANQQEKTYSPVPYYLCNNRYGLFVDTNQYVRFDMAKTNPEHITIYIDMQNTAQQVYLFFGENEQISAQYAAVAGHASPMPAWAYGVWLSANEWNTQSEAMEQLSLARAHGIDVAVLVLEAWSDEVTFYRFSEEFSDPKALVDAAHAQGTKVLFWQIPVLKCTPSGNAYSRADEIAAIQNRYVIMNANGTPYRMPDGWFGRSMLIDFTNPEATAWFLGKRKYLIDEIGIDGFKTDGGEFFWGMEAAAQNGQKGRELRNAYPDLYALSYQELLNTVTFSRAAGTNAQQHSLLWTGDQYSTFDEFQACVRAILNMNVSGMPFVAFDIAGFAGELPTSELYQRAVAFAAFTPIMQVHSEASGNPVPSQARTPWNMAERKNDPMCLTTFQKYARINADLRPYMLEQAELSCETGVPLLRSMAYCFPNDEIACEVEFQFMLGDQYLIAPVVKPRVTEWSVYLPQGHWQNIFTGEEYEGCQWIVCSAQLDEIPVFQRTQ